MEFRFPNKESYLKTMTAEQARFNLVELLTMDGEGF